MKNNLIQKKSFDFAVRIVNLYKYLVDEKKEYTLSKQLLHSGTSIGANTEEALGGQSKKDFIAKLSIAYKEAREVNYWLRILQKTNYLSKEQFDAIYPDLEEIQKILVSILKTSKKNCENNNS